MPDGAYAANVKVVERLEQMDGATGEETKEPAAEAGSTRGASLGGDAFFDYSPYTKFAALIVGKDSLRPKRRPLAWVMRLIEEVYDKRYARDTADLRAAEGDAGVDDVGRMSLDFPVFLVEFFTKRYGLRQLVEQTCWDLLYNVNVLRRQFLEVEIFARFLEEFYDHDDLLFFLYVRSVIQKELNVPFRARWSEFGRGANSKEKLPRAVYLTHKDCQTVARIVFGSDADPLYKAFLGVVEAALQGQDRRTSGGQGDSRRIEVTQFLHLALTEYRETRPEEDAAAAAGSPLASAPPPFGGMIPPSSPGRSGSPHAELQTRMR